MMNNRKEGEMCLSNPNGKSDSISTNDLKFSPPLMIFQKLSDHKESNAFLILLTCCNHKKCYKIYKSANIILITKFNYILHYFSLTFRQLN